MNGFLRFLLISLTVAVTACAVASPPSPSLVPPNDDPGPPPPIPTTDGTTFILTNQGVSPKQARVYQGSRVRVVNNDSAVHEIQSNPLHLHTDCPELNVIGFVVTGQERVSDPMQHIRGCGFHDHVNDGDTRYYATVWVDAR